MKTNKLKKIILTIILSLVIIISGSLFFLKQNTYSASQTALDISSQSSQNKKYDLYSTNEESPTAIIFYPGALVEKESYSIWATDLSKKGYDVYILKLPLNLAILSPNAAKEITDSLKNKQIILAGHSLGGVMASRFAAKNAKIVDGIVFLASYPDKKGNLQETNTPALSITATKDNILNKDSYESSKQYLPENVTYSAIDGGNHSGFGSYGLQKKDGTPTISNEAQQQEISNLIDEWLKSLK